MNQDSISFTLHSEDADWPTNDTEYRWELGNGVSGLVAVKRADGKLDVTLRATGYEPVTMTTTLPSVKRGGVGLFMKWPDEGRARLTLNGTETTYAGLRPRSKLRPPSDDDR